MDARTKQRLAGVDIADANHDALVHNEILDRQRAIPRAGIQQRSVKSLRKRFGSEMSQQRVLFGAAIDPQYRTETPGII